MFFYIDDGGDGGAFEVDIEKAVAEIVVDGEAFDVCEAFVDGVEGIAVFRKPNVHGKAIVADGTEDEDEDDGETEAEHDGGRASEDGAEAALCNGEHGAELAVLVHR